MSKEVIIGIDLGTGNSCVSILENGVPKVILNSEGKTTTPSVVGFAKNGEILVGEVAKRQAITNPKNTIYSIKRFMGVKEADSKEEAKMVPFKVEAGNGGMAVINVDGQQYTPQELSAKILSKLKKAAEDYLGVEVKKAIITCPAFFNDNERVATKQAGEIAGLEVLRVINEPTSACLLYQHQSKDMKSQKVAVYDFGSGTLDCSIVEVGDGVVEVLATGGDVHLGGSDCDQMVMNYLMEQFKTSTGVDISSDAMALQRLNDAAEKAKIELSSSNSTDINLPFLTANQNGPQHLAVTLTRAKFEQLIRPIIEKTLVPCKRALADANLKISDLSEVLLVGGSTRIPLVRQMVEEMFGRKPNHSLDADLAVSFGAAIQGAVLSGDVTDILLLDVTPLSLGIETVGGVMTKLIDRNTTIPTKKSQTFSTAADNQTAVTVRVLQGERSMARDNMELANFALADIPMAPRGTPQIEVSFNIDANGIVSVSAKDLGTGKEQNIVVTGSTKLSEEEVQRMVKDAELNAEADKERKEIVDAKNGLDSMVFGAEKMIKDNKDKVSLELITELEKEVEAAKTKLQSESLSELKTTSETLQAAIYKISEELYKSAPKPEEQAANE